MCAGMHVNEELKLAKVVLAYLNSTASADVACSFVRNHFDRVVGRSEGFALGSDNRMKRVRGMCM